MRRAIVEARMSVPRPTIADLARSFDVSVGSVSKALKEHYERVGEWAKKRPLAGQMELPFGTSGEEEQKVETPSVPPWYETMSSPKTVSSGR